MKRTRTIAFMILFLLVGAVLFMTSLAVIFVGRSLGVIGTSKSGLAEAFCTATLAVILGVAILRFVIWLFDRPLNLESRHSWRLERWINDPNFRFRRPPATVGIIEGRVVLRVIELEESWDSVLQSVEVHLVRGFCRSIRRCKLLYFQNDRQEPGRYDETAKLIRALGDELLQCARKSKFYDSSNPVWGSIEDHVREIGERLKTELSQRGNLDRDRLGEEYQEIRPINWKRPDENTSPLPGPVLDPVLV